MAGHSDLTKEDLFQGFLANTRTALDDWERRFQVEGMADLVFVDGRDDESEARALRNSNAWKILSDLYEYAVNGIDNSEDNQTSFLVTEGAEVLELVTTYESSPSPRWEEIVWMADGRFGLDDGQYIDVRKLALLANVDVRTVRNAISAGDLESFKTDAGVFIENAPARRWLLGRRGFKPTVVRAEEVRLDLNLLTTPGEVAAFMAARRLQLGGTVDAAPTSVQSAIEKIEAGVFDMPLDVAKPLAAFYQLPFKDLLQCVMGVFFPEALEMLTSGGVSELDARTSSGDSTKRQTPSSADKPKHPKAGSW